MRATDLVVEVRDRTMVRKGIITAPFLNLKARIKWCGVGEWSLVLPGNHPMVPHLSTPGSGIIVSGPVDSTFTPGSDGVGTRTPVDGVIFSGPTSAPERVRNRENPDGTFTFTGVTDEVHLASARAFPNPAIADPTAQDRANDTRTGRSEALLRQYVAYNITYDQAPAGRVRGARQYIDLVGVDQGRGITLQKSPRYQVLLELLQEIVAYDPSLGFRMRQTVTGGLIGFEVLTSRDRRGSVRFDVENGTVTSEQVMFTGPSVTDAIVAGQGEGDARTIVRRQTAESVAAENTWGVVWETFIDQRDTDDLAELAQSGDEALLEGRGGTSVKMVPSDDLTMQYGIHWREGDQVTTVVNGQETIAVVTEAVILANSDGVMVGAALGDVSGFEKQDSQASKVLTLDQRVSNLERASLRITPEMLPAIPDAVLPSRLMGVEVSDWNSITQPGFYYSGGSAANSPGSGGTWVGTALWNGDRLVVEVSNATTAPLMKKTYRRVWLGTSWTPWYETNRHDLPATSPTPVAPFALYGAHSGGTPSGSPFVRISGGFCSVKVVVVNEGTSAVSISGGGIVGENFPVPLATWTLSALTMLTSSLGGPRTEFGAQMDTGGKIGIRGTSYSVPAGDKFIISGVYPVDSALV